MTDTNRDAPQLVTYATGGFEIEVGAQPTSSDTVLSFYKIQLVDKRFRGFPTSWLFGLFEEPFSDYRTAAAIKEAQDFESSLPESQMAALISSSDGVGFADEFRFSHKNLFCVEGATPERLRSRRAVLPRNTPLVVAIRSRIKAKHGVRISPVSPYVTRPVVGWRFFGRERELGRLVDEDSNFVVVGARRIGKTSLLQEAERRLKKRGEETYFVDAQACQTSGEVVAELMRRLSVRDASSLVRRNKALDESVLETLLRQFSRSRHRTTIFLDELGNVIASLPKEDWSFLGLLRKYSMRGNLRFVISCFQEVFLKQQDEFDGPLINFANTLRLGAFSSSEVEQMLTPIEIWRPMDKREVSRLVRSTVGQHPYFLQLFFETLLSRVLRHSVDVTTGVRRMLRGDQLAPWISEPADEIFFRLKSPLLRALFLQRCLDTDKAGSSLKTAVFDDDWLESCLTHRAMKSTTLLRRNLLDALEVRGLTISQPANRGRHTIAAPILFEYIRSTESSLERYAKKCWGEAAAGWDSWSIGDV